MDVRDGTHNSPKYINNGYPLITSKDFKEGRFDLSKTKYISEKDYQDIIKRSKVEVGDILYSMIGGNIGSMIRINQDNYFDMAIKNVALFKPYQNENINTKYIAYLLESKVREYQTIAIGGAQPFVGLDVFRNSLVPFPPLSEQHRIVAEIEKWFALIDAIESGKTNMQAAIKQAKSKILNLAIHGKLVPQDPSDEPASELLKRINPKAEITCDNGQYGKIPDEWCLCKLGDIGEIVTGNTPTKDIEEYYGGNIPFYKPSDLDEGKFIKNASDNLSVLGFEQARKIPANSILVTCIGATIGKTGLIIVEGSCNQQINAIIPNEAAYAEFIYYTCISDYMQKEIKSNASATTLPILNKRNFAKLPFPLPPLAEQQHIVTKIEELFTSLDNIQKALEV